MIATVLIRLVLFIVEIVDTVLDLLILGPRNKRWYDDLPSRRAKQTIQVDSSDPGSPYQSLFASEYAASGGLFKIDSVKHGKNLYDAIRRSCVKHVDKPAMGVREIIKYEDERQENGKVFKKSIMKNEYEWITYGEMLTRIDNLSNGLLKLGLKSNDSVVIFAETRPEWFISAMACMRIKALVVTLYSTLGLDALVYGVNQSDARYIITSSDGFQKLQTVLPQLPNLKYVFVMTNKVDESSVIQGRSKLPVTARMYTYDELLQLGQRTAHIKAYIEPSHDDLAIVMYTSGSTGTPKGVMMSHLNLLSSLNSFTQRLGKIRPGEVYIGYLPLAHVLELCSEIGFYSNGVPVGYSSPFTLTDASTAIKTGQMGDMRVLKPTVMVSVPIVLERLKKGVFDKLAKASPIKKELFRLAYQIKLRRFKRGSTSFLLDKILFGKINEAVLGGRMRLIVCGGALLNKEIQEFGQVCLCNVVQAYGLTETCAAAASQFMNTTEVGHVGCPVVSSQIKLVDWLEGNYRCTDRPNPRGEIWISGENVTKGYYKMPEKTDEDFRVVDGVRYFCTGDIGEISNDSRGVIRIIDRKKDLVKLATGEYVSLNKVEAVIKLMPIVENCCVIAQHGKSNCVCLISGNANKLAELLGQQDLSAESDRVAKKIELRRRRSNEIIDQFITQMDKSSGKLSEIINKDLTEHCLRNGLERFEIPGRFRLVKETWLPDTGLVTDSLKLKRKEIEAYYAREIAALYSTLQ